MNESEYEEEIKALKQKVLDKARKVLGRGVGAIWVHEKIIEFSKEVSQEVENYDACIGYHVLIGSSIDKEMTPLVEFSTPHSVKSFCLSLLDELSEI